MNTRMKGIKVVAFDIGWTLMDETGRLEKTCKWLAETLEEVGIFVTKQAAYDAYLEVCCSPRMNLGSKFIETLLELKIPFDMALSLRDKSPWETFALDVYPMTRTVLSDLRINGFKVVALANQEKSTRKYMEDERLLEFFDAVWLSKEVGLKKPDVSFFGKILREFRVRPFEVLYVGDRLDNDVQPCALIGMRTARIKTGPFRNQLWQGVKPDLEFDDLEGFYDECVRPS